MTKNFQLHPLAKIVRYSARVHGIPELGLYKGRFAALKADIKKHDFTEKRPLTRITMKMYVSPITFI